MNPDAFSLKEVARRRSKSGWLSTRPRSESRTRSPRKARAARTRKTSQGLQDMPGSGSDVRPHEIEPTADAPLNSNAEEKNQAQPRPKMLNFGN